ncbi:uncharacterized protein LY89DRAFT_727330 [Mollisia scopiformis]|uniref:RING-type domain-containing protein n=1 Tax=Mollisia scopiformis TaxID=149040 RepID=A0A194XWA7_MOLSC|nr:uncharacterized protein LY89DRAFT_727330 [Mollisia scopiformis]KUJ24299.1 hypothetical protein LY89DRAFT_727330 [Mollisia scopiformis]
MAAINQVLVTLVSNLNERGLGGDQTTTILPSLSAATAAVQSASSTSSSASPSSSNMSSTGNGGGSSGPTSSPLLFFVALGFGVVFTNLWIIVGVKYCFRYNARNRALRNGEEVDPINLENMPARPHRRRREKKLMTMDEVNERFPLTKYKNWVASRAREGLPTNGGVTAPPSRAASLRDVEGVMPSSPTDTKHTVNSRPGTAGSDGEAAEITISPATNHLGGEFGAERKSMEATAVEKGTASPTVEEDNRLQEVQTTASTVGKHPTATSEEHEDEDDEDDHIHTAVPPELLTNPGDSCAICIDTLEEDDDIRGLTCGHAFHAGCLDPWLTSRRACCPLCKADYYTPKPRPEGEAADADRTGRRRTDRTNMPQAPQSAWTGIRGNPRLILPGRFGVPIGDGVQYGNAGRRENRRARREAAATAAATDATPATGEVNAEPTPSRRWVPRISNPFSNMSMPAIRRNRQAATAESNQTVEPSPSQLEAGVVR